MSRYTCDNWVVIKLDDGVDPHYRLLVGTSGGYLTGDSWRLNSGITKVEEDDRAYYFSGSSGSTYRCGKNSYTLRMNNAHIWSQIQELHGDKAQLMPEDTDWTQIVDSPQEVLDKLLKESEEEGE